MENEVYERDYRALQVEPDPAQRVRLKRMGELLHDIDIQRPRMISPTGKFVYDYLLRECDAYCRLCCGKICAVIDYQNWDAKIVMTLPSLCCFAMEQKDLLCEILLLTKSISFSPVSGSTELSVTIKIAYFERLEYGSEEERINAMITYMLAAAEKRCGGNPSVMEKIRRIFEEYEQGQTE